MTKPLNSDDGSNSCQPNQKVRLENFTIFKPFKVVGCVATNTTVIGVSVILLISLSPHVYASSSPFALSSMPLTTTATSPAITSEDKLDSKGLHLTAIVKQPSAIHESEDVANGNITSKGITDTKAINEASESSPTDIEDALVALKLKNAVDKGIIDSSVLEEYKRETLSSANGDIHQTDQPVTNTSAPKLNQTDKETVAENAVTFDDEVILRTPAEIEQTLAEIEQQIQTDSENVFDTPVAKLDSDVQPIGYDEGIQAALPIPNTQQTLGITENLQVEETGSSLTPKKNYEGNLATNDVETNLKHSAESLDIDNKNNKNGSNNNRFLDTQSQAVNNTTLITQAGSSGHVPKDEDLTNQNPQLFTDNLITDNQDSGQITGAEIEQSQNDNEVGVGIDPSDYLPEYKESDAIANAVTDNDSGSDSNSDSEASNNVGFFKKIYYRLFYGGYASLPKIKARIYIQDESRLDDEGNPLLIKADDDTQPINNIESALENITVESITDFTSVLPRLREEAVSAAQAVGYYDINLRFVKEDDKTISVIIEQLGEPVTVNNRIIDIRGHGKDLPEFQLIAQTAPPLKGDIFNHGAYQNTKVDIEKTSQQYGFFDSRWLNSSVDIILPDNTADIDLIYDTNNRYEFGDVIFFTIDESTGRLTADPDKLPVNPKLLHQIYDFKTGEYYYQPQVTNFTNDLSATRYFNMVNVEPIMPSIADTGSADLGFAIEPNDSNNVVRADELINSEITNQETPNFDNKQQDINNLDSNINNNSNDDDDAANEASTTTQENIQPIKFTIDQQTSERLDAIAEKANRLSRLPDDRVLDEKEEEAQNLLGKISNSISSVFKKILPDEKDSLAGVLDRELTESELEERITPQEVAKTKQIPLYVFVMADKPKDVDLGIGYGTDTGVRAVARLDNNLINRNGYQAGISVGVSKLNQNLSVHGSRPLNHPLNDRLLANLSIEREVLDKGENNLDLSSNTIKASLSRDIRSDSGWNRSYSLRYRLDQLESGVDDINRKDLPIPFNRNNSKFNQEALLLGYTLDKTQTNNLIHPTQGWRQTYSLEAGSKDVLTDTDMAIAKARLNGVYSFGEFDKHQVVGRIEAGYIWADDFESVPYKLRYFAGGDGSIRGYDYNSLSPVENGYLLGGQVLGLASAEYNYEFKPGFRGAVFADVGNAYDTNFSNETKVGLGFGIRWASPVGMVRADLAAGVLENSIPVRLHFYIGSALQ